MARSFNGTSDFIATGMATSVFWTAGSQPTAFTFATWALFTTVQSGNIMADVTSAGAGPTAGIIYLGYDTNTANNWAAAISDNAFANFGLVQLAQTISTNTWYHIVLTYDGVGTTTGLTLFFNGSSTGSGQSNTGTGIPTTGGVSTDLISCGANNSGNGALPGAMADSAWWATVLTQQEITALSKGARPYTVRPTQLNFYLPLDGLASPEPDYTFHKRNGTLTGTSLRFNGPPVMMFTPRKPQFPPLGLDPMGFVGFPNVTRRFQVITA